MNTEQEPTVTPDAELNKSPFLPVDMSHLEAQPPTVSGELPGGDGLLQSTEDEVITEVPGANGDAFREPSIIDSDPDQVAIAQERQRQAEAELTRVTGQTALQSTQLDSNTPE